MSESDWITKISCSFSYCIKGAKGRQFFFFFKLLFIYFWLLWVLVVAHGLQSAWAQLLYGMWDHPWSGIEPVSPVLEGGLPPTGPPGKSQNGSSDQAKNKMEKKISFIFSFLWKRKSVHRKDLIYRRVFLKNVAGYFWYLFALPANCLKKLK